MKIERSKNAGRNILFGVLQNLYNIFVPFLLRTALIYLLGEQYLGLNSLFGSVLQVLNLAELGVGSAMVYCMYKPIAEDDTDTICALVALYRKYYFYIGAIIALAGLSLTPVIPRLIKMDTVPADMNVYFLYWLNLASTVLSYWALTYKSSLLSAHQRTDISSKIEIGMSVITYGAQFAILIFWHNFYLYTAVTLIVGVIGNLLTAWVVDRMYPRYHPKGVLPKEITGKIGKSIRDLFTSKLGAVIYDSADTIVISAFLGMTVLAVYQNYFYILTAVTSFIAIVFRSVTAGIGNSLTVESEDKNYLDLRKFTFIIVWIAGFCTCCLLAMYQPFMELWMGKRLMLSYSAVVCFGIYFFIRQINSLLNLYKDAAGMWHEDRFRPLIAALFNLVLNLILVQYIGIYGVILSTVLAILVVGEPWLLYNLFSVIFRRERLTGYLKELLSLCCISFAACCAALFVCRFITPESLIVTLAGRLAVCLIVPNLIYWLCLRRWELFRLTVDLFNTLTGGRLHAITDRLIPKQ